MICLTQTAFVSTMGGRRTIGELSVNDMIMTGTGKAEQPKAIMNRVLTGRDLTVQRHLKPILIRAGALGTNLPTHDMMVSPNQRVQVHRDLAPVHVTEEYTFVAAKHLVNNDGVFEMTTTAADFIHICFPGHTAIAINGLWVECFQPNDTSYGSVGNAQWMEVLELFPDLKYISAPPAVEPIGEDPEPAPKKKRFFFF